MALRLGKELLYLCGAEVAHVGPSMEESLAAIREAFRQKGLGVAQQPPKTALHPVNEDAFLHAMPAYVPEFGAAGVKWVSGYPDNPPMHGLPYISGLLVLSDVYTGMPIAVMDCAWITAQRTGAVSGLAAQALAAPASVTAGLLGAGVQARTQLLALATAIPTLRSARVYDVAANAANRFVKDMGAVLPQFSLQIVDSAEAAVRDADIVVTAGPIRKEPQPLVRREWLKPGALGLPIDFDSMWTRSALGAGRYYVDDLEQYRYYEAQGYFRESPQPVGDLGDLSTGRVEGRQSADEVIVAMNLGVAIADMAMAAIVYQRALAAGTGTVLPL
ncbi:MAG: ornithine cyclodeaminase family protein [Thermaerobacter sp.]|nr:ornithine cyclodeaminase family protein [Thermaerobacter sp.]